MPLPCTACPHRSIGFCARMGREWNDAVLDDARYARTYGPGEVIYRADRPLSQVSLLRNGWAASCELLPDGSRQILELLLPGDLFSSLSLHEASLPFTVIALTEVRTCSFDIGLVHTYSAQWFDLLQAWSAREISRLQRRLVDLGRRRGDQRLAALLLELADRLQGRSEVRGDWLPLPLRQADLADMLGLTPVHVSRLLTRFRRAGWLQTRAGSFRIVDREAIGHMAGKTGKS